MAITRLGQARPTANSPAVLATLSDNYLVSVVATNLLPTTTPIPKVTIYITPAGATLESQFVYICSNLTLSYGTSFETFRFATNAGDTIYCRSTTDNCGFMLNGILQDDVVGQGDLSQTFTNKTIRGLNNTLYLDKGNTSQRRPEAEVGYVRFNTEFDTLEVRTSQGWRRLTLEVE